MDRYRYRGSNRDHITFTFQKIQKGIDDNLAKNNIHLFITGI